MPAWSLPEAFSDILPAEARRIEELRRELLDLFRRYGYELVMPPLVEFTESLLSGTGRDLDLQMFKLVDQVSGRTMGLRPDITPQVARIDAHLLNRKGVTRLCYAGSVVHTRAQGVAATREPLQIGAEIYGHAGLEADLETQELLLAALSLAGAKDVRLDLGDAGILQALLAQEAQGRKLAEEVYPYLQAKDVDGLAKLDGELLPETASALKTLCGLYGGLEVLARARAELPPLPRLSSALDRLERLAAALPAELVTLDLADVRGYHYHSGPMFSAYCAGVAGAVARGGRYDEVGAAFGRARPAVGFSLYLRDLASLWVDVEPPAAIRAPWVEDKSLRNAIAALRAGGEIVVQLLPGQAHHNDEFHCDRHLVKRGTTWHIEPLTE